ncbi:MAG: tetratricopeptide repeat protein, partial [Odoribacter sp.]|nr:tetratricopeptide repeat protein [Odoribacter sp.]
MKFAYILLLILLPLFVQAQKSDSQLAYTYYQNKEYDKAGQLFLQLYERTRSSNYLDYYIICLINGKQYDKAETALKKYLKTDDRNKEFLVNLGYVYEQQGKTKKSEEYYEKAVQRLIPSTSDVNSLANKFRNIREYGWAVKAYLQGQKIL